MNYNKLYIYTISQDHRTSYFKSPPIKFMNSLNWILLELNNEIIHNYENFTNYLTNNNIKVILCFCCSDYLVELYKNFFEENNIIILSYSNDLHNKNNIITTNKKNSIDLIHNFKNVYICANYYYCYLNFYNIISNRIIKYPVFVDDDYYIDFNKIPINKILLSGTITKQYPARKKMNQISNYNKNIEVLKNGIYQGFEYIKYLNKYLCCFTCCANKNLPYILAKFFEIPSSGSLLFSYDEFVKDELNNLGFIDGINYISCTFENMEEKIEYILHPNNLEKINLIRNNGYEFVWKYHKQTNRLNYIDDFVNKNFIN